MTRPMPGPPDSGPRARAIAGATAPALRELAEHIRRLAPVITEATAKARAAAMRPRGRAAQRSPYDIGDPR